MGTINSAFAIIASGLNADQSALNIVANNVANANTNGYTREVPNWSENAPVKINGMILGSGVSETGPTSVRDRVLGQRLIQQQQTAAASSARLSALNALQAVFPPDSGASSATAGDIGYDITSFFGSFASLEANSTNNALRQQVLSSAVTLAGDISNAAASINAQQDALDQEASGIADQLNALTSAIAQLNQQMQSAGNNAGALEDQRQLDLTQLAELVGINQVTTENNGLSLTTTSGLLLVSGNANFAVSTGAVAGVTHFFLGATDITAGLAGGGGQLGGYLTARDQDIPQVLGALDELAYGIATAVNTQNNEGAGQQGVQGTGTTPNGQTGTGSTPLYIFQQPQQVAGSALSMRVTMSDPNQIAAAGFDGGTGDNSNARVMANLGSESLQLPIATTGFSLTQNLSSNTPSLPPGNTVTESEQVFDSLGQTHQLTVAYANQGGGQWTYSLGLSDRIQADTSVVSRVSYVFGSGETVDPSTDFVISGFTASGVSTTISAPPLSPGEALGDASKGYVKALNDALAAANIVGVTVTGVAGVLTVAGASSTSGNVLASLASSINATGNLQFSSGGALISPASDIAGITFSGFADGAAPMVLDWSLYESAGVPNLTQTAAPSAVTALTQNGAVFSSQAPTDFYANFVSALGTHVSQVQIENTAQDASVTQLQTQQNALSAVNLNDEAAAMQQFERSYQAASEVFAILNSIMASALNLGVQTAVS